jgi:CRISPR-associated protein Cmr3
MRYKITLKPLAPFLFGGDNTFGTKGDEENGTYLVHSREFPQQSALQGMLKKEMMTQAGLLTRKIRGEWVDKRAKEEAEKLVGKEKFSINSKELQNFGALKSISPLFLSKNGKNIIKKVAIDSYTYKDKLLQDYKPKVNIYDNFVAIDNSQPYKSSDIFQKVEQVGIKKGGGDNAFFKKTSYLLKDDFLFTFFIESDFELKNAIVTLGADSSPFKMQISLSDEKLEYEDKNGYLTLLSDAYITLNVKEHCEFAITSEISYRNLVNKKHATKHSEFQKSSTVFLYEKGSVFINPTPELIENLNNKNCQQLGYNIYSKGQN